MKTKSNANQSIERGRHPIWKVNQGGSRIDGLPGVQDHVRDRKKERERICTADMVLPASAVVAVLLTAALSNFTVQ